LPLALCSVAAMLETPFRFEASLTSEEFCKLGQLSLRWSLIEHVIANCLKVLLRLTDEEAIVVVFPLGVEQRLQKLKQVAALTPLNADAQAAFDELKAVMPAIQFVRNTVAHSVVSETEDGEQIFHLRSKKRSLTKAEVFGAEELTNYAAHVVYSLRYALGLKGSPGDKFPMPPRPAIPPFLKSRVGARDNEIGE